MATLDKCEKVKRKNIESIAGWQLCVVNVVVREGMLPQQRIC